MPFNLDMDKLENVDASVLVNYPSSLTGVVKAMVEILNKQKKIVVLRDTIDVATAREIVQNATGDTQTYQVIPNASDKVWAILREAIEQDRIRVLGIFHGRMPESLPDNCILIDIGRSLRKPVSKPIIANLSEAILKKNLRLVGAPSQLHQGLQVLCYEVLYTPEARTFPHKVAQKVPRGTAFKFLYEPPTPPTEANFNASVIRFLQEVIA